MIRENSSIIDFIDENKENELLPDFFNKCYDKLKDLNKLEEKFNYSMIFVIMLHLIFTKENISSLDFGPINIKDVSIIPIIIPVILTYVLFNLYVINKQKKKVTNALKIYSYTFYRQEYTREHLKENILNNVTRLFLPFTFSTEISSILENKPNVLTAFIGFVLLLPLVLIGLLPYFFLTKMLLIIHNEYYCTTLGFYSFWICIWMFLVMMFYLITSAIAENKKDKDFIKSI
jgi:uncharacterized membrane protein